VLQCRRRVL